MAAIMAPVSMFIITTFSAVTILVCSFDILVCSPCLLILSRLCPCPCNYLVLSASISQANQATKIPIKPIGIAPAPIAIILRMSPITPHL